MGGFKRLPSCKKQCGHALPSVKCLVCSLHICEIVPIEDKDGQNILRMERGHVEECDSLTTRLIIPWHVGRSNLYLYHKLDSTKDNILVQLQHML